MEEWLNNLYEEIINKETELRKKHDNSGNFAERRSLRNQEEILDFILIKINELKKLT